MTKPTPLEGKLLIKTAFRLLEKLSVIANVNADLGIDQVQINTKEMTMLCQAFIAQDAELKELRKERSEARAMAEFYGEASNWLHREQWADEWGTTLRNDASMATYNYEGGTYTNEAGGKMAREWLAKWKEEK